MSTLALDPLANLSEPVRRWFVAKFPGGPTPAQQLAWPIISEKRHLLLTAPTGNGKTLAAFLAILDHLARTAAATATLRCVYVSPLRSLANDIERNLHGPLNEIRQLDPTFPVINVAVRTGDTTSHQRAKQRETPPHLLITTPESLSLLLSQPVWTPVWSGVEYIIVDEIHAIAASKRGADLMVSLERLSASCQTDPVRIGLSATCRPVDSIGSFLVGPRRSCSIAEADAPADAPPLEIAVESLQEPGEAPYRPLTHQRLVSRLKQELESRRLTIIFANTRAYTEKLTHDLRQALPDYKDVIAAHHSSLDIAVRAETEARLKRGELRAIVTSTSLELGVDITTADLTVLIGLPGSTARCLQRIGRSGHNVNAQALGLMLAATPAELVGAIVTARSALEARIESIRTIHEPLDVLCQQLIGMACSNDWGVDDAWELLRKSAPLENLNRSDFDACLQFLAGELASPPGAFEPEPGATPRWSCPRIWKSRGRFGIRSKRVALWFRSNVGTIYAEETCKVLIDGVELGFLESAYAERLLPGDCFLLDGRALAFVRMDENIVHASLVTLEANLPQWTSDRQGLSRELASALAQFRDQAAQQLLDGPEILRNWLRREHRLSLMDADILVSLFVRQDRMSEIPNECTLLIEESPHAEGFVYVFHAPLGRAACEALARATASRIGQVVGQNLVVTIADLGWSIQLPDGKQLTLSQIPTLLEIDQFESAVLDGVDRGDILAGRFRRVASTALMVLKRPESGKPRVGGMLWVSQKLYPVVKACCPHHPLIKETRREVLEDCLDAPAALAWLQTRPQVRFRALDNLSPFASVWIEPARQESIEFESPEDALRRLHARLLGG